MPVEIITQESFNICGISTELTASQAENFKIIKSLWQKFNNELRVKQINLGQHWVKYGVTKRNHGQLTYMAAVPLSAPLAGFTQNRIAGGEYACFHHTGSLELIKKTIHSIYTEKIPAGNIVVDVNRVLIHYEYYDYRFAWNKPDSIIDIFVPIQ